MALPHGHHHYARTQQEEDEALRLAISLSIVDAATPGAKCAGCHGALGFGAHVVALDRNWHVGCLRCCGCQQPIHSASFNVSAQEGLPYHKECFKELFHPRCIVCRDFVPVHEAGRIQWQESPFWKERYCPSHARDGTPACCACGRLQPRHGEEGVTLSDGRLLCIRCLDTSLMDTKDAQPLYDEVLLFFRRMGMAHEYRAPLMLVAAPVLEEYAGREGGRLPGPVFHIRGLCIAHTYTSIPSIVRLTGLGASGVGSAALPMLRPTSRTTVTCILVAYGLPRLLTGSILAHELMHAFLRMRHVHGLPAQVEEGLCQLMAYLWLEAQDGWAHSQQQGEGYQVRLASYLANSIRTDASAEYGEGFRLAHEAFQARGLRALVEAVISTGAFPRWGQQVP